MCMQANTIPPDGLADELKVEGVEYKGYGKIFKLVMFDLELTIEAKAIYAYFCSYAGKGNQAFPSQKKILVDLIIKNNSYYNHFRLLTSQGYIKVEHKYFRGKVAGNVYILADKPSKYFEPPPNAKASEIYEKVRKLGIRSLGYGTIPKAVMQDCRISIKSKGIYAFLAALAGDSDHSYPKHEDMLYYLRISNPTFYKHYLPLMELNYITPIRKRENGTFTGTDFYINNFPDLKEAKHRRLNLKRKMKEAQTHETIIGGLLKPMSETQTDKADNKNDGIEPFSPLVKKPLVEKPLVEKPIQEIFEPSKNDGIEPFSPLVKKPLVEKPETKRNSFKKKQYIQNHTQNQSVFKNDTERRTNENMPNIYSQGSENTNETELNIKTDTLPFGSHAQTVDVVHAATNFGEISSKYASTPSSDENEFTYSAFCLVNQAIVEMLTTQKSMLLCKQNVTRDMVYEKLRYCLGISAVSIGNKDDSGQLSMFQAESAYKSGGVGGLTMVEIVEQAISSYQKGYQYNATQGKGIGFALQYMEACVWTVIITGKTPTLKPGTAVGNSTPAVARPQQKRNRFCNFKEREIDFAELERRELELLMASMKENNDDGAVNK